MFRHRLLPALIALASVASSAFPQAGAPAAPPPTAADLVPEWRIGAAAERDLFAPADLLVRDPDTEAQLRMRAADSVSSIYRFDPSLADEAAEELGRAFAESREKFQKDLGEKFGGFPLTSAQYTSDEFRAFRKEWSDATSLFPPKFAIARAWAQGQPGDEHLGPYREKLVRTLRDTYLAEELPPPDAAVGPAEVRLVTVAKKDEVVTAATVATSAVTLRRAQILTLAQARDLLRDSMVREDWPAARFLGRKLRSNTFFEAALTRAERDLRARDAVPPPERIVAGRAIVRAGETITPRHHAALAELKRIVAADPVAGGLFAAQIRGEPPPEPAGAKPVAPWMNWTFIVVLPLVIGVMAVALLVAVVLLFRRARKPAPGTALDAPAAANNSTVVAALRDAAVQRLYDQRQDLLAGQHASSAEVESLEQRINRLQPQLQEKLRVYAGRIAALESELARVRGDDQAARVRDALDHARQERDAELLRAGVSR